MTEARSGDEGALRARPFHEVSGSEDGSLLHVSYSSCLNTGSSRFVFHRAPGATDRLSEADSIDLIRKTENSRLRPLPSLCFLCSSVRQPASVFTWARSTFIFYIRALFVSNGRGRLWISSSREGFRPRQLEYEEVLTCAKIFCR